MEKSEIKLAIALGAAPQLNFSIDLTPAQMMRVLALVREMDDAPATENSLRLRKQIQKVSARILGGSK